MNRTEAYGRPPPAREGEPQSPRCQGGFTQVHSLGKLHGRGWGVKPALEFWSQLRSRRPATLGMIRPKSWHKSLAQAGSAGAPTRQPPPKEPQCLVREGGALVGLHGTCGEGPGGPQGTELGEAVNPGPWPRLAASFPFRSGRQKQVAAAQTPSTEPPKQTVAAASRLLGSCFREGRAAAHLVGFQAPSPRS